MGETTDELLKIREDLPLHMRMGLGLSSVVLALLAWVWMTSGDPAMRWISPLILPSPAEVLAAFGPLHWEQGLARSTVASLIRVTLGFGLAAAVAVPLGILMGAFSKVGAFFDSYTLFGGYVPVVCLIPITIAWFGLSEAQKVAFLFIGTVVFLLPMVVKIVQELDDVYLQTGYTLGADRWQTLWHVIIPCTKSRIFNIFRIFYGVGWGYIILAEMSDQGTPGLGALIASCQRRSKVDQVFAVLIVIVFIAVAVDQLLKWTGQWLFPYEEEV